MKRAPFILLLVAAALFVAGLLHLFHLRFEAGDVYPPYSSLRADPLGTKALFESVDRLLPVRRHFQSPNRLGDGRDTTLLVLGLSPLELRSDPEELKQLESFVADGGRLVIALVPQSQRPVPRWSSLEERSSGTNNPASTNKISKARRPARKSPFDDEEIGRRFHDIDLGEHWKFTLDYGPARRDEHGVIEPVEVNRRTDAPLPETLEWHSVAFFSKPDKPWRAIYAREKDRAVVMQRSLGRGTIVLLTDSYPFSNESLREQNHAGLLAWIVGPNRQVIFNETHLGVQEDPGIAALARKYRLGGVCVALVVLAGLFIWKNAVPFMLPPAEQIALERGDEVAGKESAAGFVNLLRRNLRASEVLETCFTEWKRSCGRAVPPAKFEQIQAIMAAEASQPARARNPVVVYQKCCEILARVKRET